MFVIGLTGSIATGKTTISKWFKELGAPVFDADTYAHKLFESDKEVISFIKKTWPHCMQDAKVNRECLRIQIIEEKPALKKIEAIIHPKVKEGEEEFIKGHRKKRKPVVVLDVPLLYESGQNELCDCVLLTYCSATIQRKRAESRGISKEMLDYLMSQQLPLSEKIRQADFKINTDETLDQTYNLLIKNIKEIERLFNVRIIKD